MIPLPFLKNKTVAVLGLGKTGHAVVGALRAAEANIVVWDDNLSARSDFSDGRVMLAPPQQWQWDAIDLVVLSPGLPYTHPEPHIGVQLAQEYGVEIVGDIELLYRACPDATYIAITGTNGKSTTASLIAHILESAGKTVRVGGNLGVPALDFDVLGADGIYVLELSSYQLDLVCTTQLDVAVLLNVSPDHLDRHGDMDGYIAAKKHIFDRQGKGDIAVMGVDDAASEALCHDMIANGVQRIVPIMTTQRCDQGIWVEAAQLHNPLGESEVVEDLSGFETLQGTHNHQNAAAAYAACWSVGLTHEAIVAGMKTYPGLAHRMQLVGQHHGVRFVNDSKATNADAAARSLGTYKNIHWIVGGVAKEGGIESLGVHFSDITHAYLIGESQYAFAETLEGHVPYTKCETMDKAFADAVANAQEGEVVLLAPACASFDQFKNFELRGDAFVALVEAWGKQEASHAV